MANWSELGKDLLGLIANQISTMEDIVRFGAVCRTWHSVVEEEEKLDFPNIADPWLMLAEKEDSDKRGFFSLSTGKVYYFDLPEARGRSYVSSRGWLLTLGLDLEIHLLNPLTRKRIRLPPQTNLPTWHPGSTRTKGDPKYGEYLFHTRAYFISKVILSSTPTTLSYNKEKDEERCVVMIITWNRLAFLRLGDEVWTPVDTNVGEAIYDAIYFNGQFYAVTVLLKLVMVDISSPHPKTITIAEAPEGTLHETIDGALAEIQEATYLVESAGELLMVSQYVYQEYKSRRLEIYETEDFHVYKFNFDNKKWTRVKRSLKERALFVGGNSSFSILPSIDNLRCKPNCIYFTDIERSGLLKDAFPDDNILLDGVGKDMGVYRMETEDVDEDEIYVGPDIVSRICAPIWISPSR